MSVPPENSVSPKIENVSTSLSPKKEEKAGSMRGHDIQKISSQQSEKIQDVAKKAATPENTSLEKKEEHHVDQKKELTLAELTVEEVLESVFPLARDKKSLSSEQLRPLPTDITSPSLLSKATIQPFDQQAKQDLASTTKGKEPTVIATADVASSRFLEQRIGGPVLSTAHDVVNSLNKRIIHTAPIDKNRTLELEQVFLSTLPDYGIISDEETLRRHVLKEKIGITDFKLKDLSGGSGAKA